MITLTIECSRCGKEVSYDVSNNSLSDDLIRKFGFSYAHDGKTNVLLCTTCVGLHKDLKERLDRQTHKELCEFFKNCEGEENGDCRGTKVG